MKRILIVSHGAALGGSPISALNIGRTLDPARFEVVFAFGEQGPIVEQARSEGFTAEVVSHKGPLGLTMIRSYLALIRRQRIDIVHLNTLTSYYKYPGLAAWLSGKPVAWFVRENPEEKRCVRLRRYLNLIARKVVTVSLDTAAHMPYVQPAKLMTIHNGVDLERFAPIDEQQARNRLDLAPGRYITTVASLEQRKGVLDLLQAYHQVRPQLEGMKLLIVGADRTQEKRYLQQLKDYVQHHGLQQDVVFYGESKDIAAVMAASCCFVMPSYWEGLSRVILEAMACAKPLIVSSNGGNKEQVWEGVNGYSFVAGDVDHLARLLLRCIDTEQMAAMGAASRQLASEHFPMAKTNAALEALYETLTG